jgi:hypothetical protein
MQEALVLVSAPFPNSTEDTQQWVDILQNYTTISECEKWWDKVNECLWKEGDARLLRAFYVRKVATLAALDFRNNNPPSLRPVKTYNNILPNIEKIGQMFAGKVVKPQLPPCPF